MLLSLFTFGRFTSHYFVQTTTGLHQLLLDQMEDSNYTRHQRCFGGSDYQLRKWPCNEEAYIHNTSVTNPVHLWDNPQNTVECLIHTRADKSHFWCRRVAQSGTLTTDGSIARQTATSTASTDGQAAVLHWCFHGNPLSDRHKVMCSPYTTHSLVS